jgi:hypothetical protein
VVGHSNTVPLIIEALGAAPTSIGPDEYDRFFIVLKRQRADSKFKHPICPSAPVSGLGDRVFVNETVTYEDEPEEEPQAIDYLVARGGIEPPTRGFSVHCSTD